MVKVRLANPAQTATLLGRDEYVGLLSERSDEPLQGSHHVDRRDMLAAIDMDSVEALFDEIPVDLRLARPPDLRQPLGEAEVYARR